MTGGTEKLPSAQAAGPARPILFCGPGNPNEEAPHQFMPAIWLASRGYSVRCLCHADGEGPVRTPLATLPVDGWTGTGLAGHVRLAAALLKHRLAGRRDTIVYLGSHTVTPAASLALAAFPPHRLIYHTQDFLQPSRHPARAAIEKAVAGRAAFVITNEPNRGRTLADFYRLPRLPTVVRTALPSNWPVPRPDPAVRRAMLSALGRADSPHARIIMAGGPPSPRRCSGELLEALRLLPEHYVVVFTDVGDAAAAAAAAQALSLPELRRRALLLKHLPYDSLLAHLAAGDMGVLLYPDDGIGNYYQAPGRLTEYLACGLPFAASNFPGLELLVNTHRLGAVCDPRAPASIAQALRSLGDHGQAEAAAEKDRLRRLAATEFAFEKQAAQIEALIRSL